MNTYELANLVRNSSTPTELTNAEGEEFLIGNELTILEDEAQRDDIILYNATIGEIVADGGYWVTADEAIKMGLTLAN